MTPSENDRTQRFDALFAAYGPDIVAYCGWRAASADDAQDAVAEVFLVAWRRLDEVPRGDPPDHRALGNNSSAWDYTVAYSGLGHTPTPVAPENATTPQPINTSSPGPEPSR